ncbi:RICIN domain-containing protein [Streptacidiphilus sp. PAMC 29251]
MGNDSVTTNGLCLDVVGATTANGSLVDLCNFNGGGNQQWTVSNGALVNPASGHCLDILASTTANGTQLDIWDCNGGANQKWNVPTSS